MSDATIFIGEKAVRRVQILGTRILTFTAWEPSSPAGGHSTITTIEGEWFGEVGTRRLTPELAAMRAMSEERSEAVGAYHRANWEECYALIVQAFPEAATGDRRSGEITLTDESLSPWRE